VTNWSSFQVGTWWPLLPGIAGILLLGVVWLRRKGSLFPDVRLLSDTAVAGGFADRLPLMTGVLISTLLMLSLMDISVSRSFEDDKRARDFLVIVDTSRSMRENTDLLRDSNPLTYERKAGLYVGQVRDPSEIPEIARYELARESLLQYLDTRRAEDRVALIYFNSMVYLMSGFTSNFNFVEQQLAGMDPYVTYGTNIRWALEQGLNLIERYPSQNRRAVILLTDAEARNTDYLQRQLDRLRKLDVAFYMLWITTDAGEGVSSLAREFLQSVRSIGSVYTIDDVAEGYLDEALAEIAKLEDYAYKETRHERIDLSQYLFSASQWLLLVWVLLLGTFYLPVNHLVRNERS
jgi:Mg-chelatase subunit ChlD